MLFPFPTGLRRCVFANAISHSPTYFPLQSKQDRLSSQFGIRGIPTLVFVDARGTVLTKEGRGHVTGDPFAKSFPGMNAAQASSFAGTGYRLVDSTPASSAAPARPAAPASAPATAAPPAAATARAAPEAKPAAVAAAMRAGGAGLRQTSAGAAATRTTPATINPAPAAVLPSSGRPVRAFPLGELWFLGLLALIVFLYMKQQGDESSHDELSDASVV
jgi:hypothetical protein